MGCGSSSVEDGSELSLEDFEMKWRLKLSRKDSKQAYIKDGTLPEDADENLLTLRVYLEDPTSLYNFATFANSNGKLYLLLCWLEILEYKVIKEEAIGMKLSKANNLYHKYVKSDAVIIPAELQKDGNQEIIQVIHKAIAHAEASHLLLLDSNLFDTFGHHILRRIHDELFVSYKETEMYAAAVKTMNTAFNNVTVDDFEYYERLGEGAFGLVVHCKKKSTGKHYAMKVQSKVGLLKCFADCPERVTYEKEAVAKCHHPFIISMDYAFQTPKLAIMVTDLGTAGSLTGALNIPEFRAVFYSAEIILALSHIHQMGMIYRDLKPANVLLNADGHIQLVDLGGVVDVGGKTLGGYLGKRIEDGLFASASQEIGDSNNQFEDDLSPGDGPGSPSLSMSATKTQRNEGTRGSFTGNMIAGALIRFGLSTNRRATRGKSPTRSYSMAEEPTLKRATSIMGTAGFMAPEMLVLLARGHKSQGYTKAVDYWSLGVLMFGMLTGFMPFHHSQVATFIEFMSDPKNKDTMPADYARFYAKITDHVKKNTMSENALKIITSFLQIDEKDRLGTRRNDIARIKEHPFFESIQWTLLEQKLVEPPFIPGALGSANADPSDTNKVENAAAVGAADSNGLELDPDQLIPLENFHVMFARYGNRIVQSTVPGQYQKLFATWDWVAPMALRAELTAQQQKKAYLEHLEELKKMPTVGGLKLLTRAFSTHRGMDPESQHGGHGQSSYRDENSTVSRGFLGDMGKRMSSHSTLSRFSSNHLGLDGSSRKGPESISSSAGMSHANLSFGISSLVSRLSVAGRLGQSDADDQQSSVSMHLSSQQPLCSPTNHGEAASFGITKNAVAISRATSLLKALETGPEVEETL